jgi:endogenous inhibitor of DNA gyrase (YacG/DUF329 family)
MTQRCPHCGNDLPSELAQHSRAPISGLVSCPHCGKDVHLEAPRPPGGKGEKEAERSETFSGHETVSGVMEELREHQEDARRKE